jgi:AhpC/TSA family
MRKPGFVALAGLILISFFALPPALDAQTKAPPKPLTLKVGDTAPDFTLLAFDGAQLKKVSLHDYRGKKNVALAFYVFAFTGG